MYPVMSLQVGLSVKALQGVSKLCAVLGRPTSTDLIARRPVTLEGSRCGLVLNKLKKLHFLGLPSREEKPVYHNTLDNR